MYEHLNRAKAVLTICASKGIPLLVKDNIGTKHLNTTAGSYALMNANQPDAEAIKKLRKAGAIILAKANMMEW